MAVTRGRAAGLVVSLLVSLVALVVTTTGAAAPVTVGLYNLSGYGTPLTTGVSCSDGCPPASATASATCSICLAPLPGSGDVSITFTSSRLIPTDPYRIQKIAGTMSISWAGGAVSTADVTGRMTDSKGTLDLTGHFHPTDPYIPSDPYRIALTWPDIYNNVAISGTLTISTG